MGNILKCENAGLWRAAASLTKTGAHWGGAPTCWAMVAMAGAIAVSSGPRQGWSAGSWRPPLACGAAATGCSLFACDCEGGLHEALVAGDGGLVGLDCSAVEGACVDPDSSRGAIPVWDSAVVVARRRVWLVREGFCSPSCRVVHMCALMFVGPCLPPSVCVPAGRCTIITCQGCDPGTVGVWCVPGFVTTLRWPRLPSCVPLPPWFGFFG